MSLTRARAWCAGASVLLAIASAGCGRPEHVQVPTLRVASQAASAPPIAARAPAPAPATLEPWPEPPEGARCVIQDDVKRGGVEWLMRTRPDAAPSLVLESGKVTTWLTTGWGAGTEYTTRYTALAQIENDVLRVRAYVGPEELRVLLAKPLEAERGVFPDGRTWRRVQQVQDDQASLDLVLEDMGRLSALVPCSELALMPHELSLAGLIPEARGKVVVAQNAELESERVRLLRVVRQLDPPMQPEGVRAELHGAADAPEPLVSIRVCGGTLLGTVHRRDLLGPLRIDSGSNASCPERSSGYFVGPRSLGRPLRCEHAIPLFVRSETLEDRVGDLLPGALFELRNLTKVAGVARDIPGHATSAIVLAQWDVAPISPATFSVRTEDLAACKPVTQ